MKSGINRTYYTLLLRKRQKSVVFVKTGCCPECTEVSRRLRACSAPDWHWRWWQQGPLIAAKSSLAS